MAYSRSSPSPHYTGLVQIYKKLHEERDTLNGIPSEQTFDGRSIVPHIKTVKQTVVQYQLRTLIDYGCGQAKAHETAEMKTKDGKVLRGLKEILGVEQIALYDPGFDPYSGLPTGTFDGILCTDVLEQCPEEDIDWIIGELFAYANKFLFCTIACFAAAKKLPNGENPHVTLKKPGGWVDKMDRAAAQRSAVRYPVWIDTHDRHLIVQG